MKVSVPSIPASGRSYEVVVDPGPLRERLADRVDIERFVACRAELMAERVDHTVTLRGTITLELLFDCSRCAEPTQSRLEFPWRIVLLPRPSRSGPAEEDEGTGYHNGREIDLDRLIVDQVVLVLPDVVLCRPECRGLCPQCGANLNDGPCTCGDRRKG